MVTSRLIRSNQPSLRHPANIKMKDKNILIQIEQLVGILRDEIDTEMDVNRNCRLQDAREYLHRAWAVIAEMTRSDNDTTIEQSRRGQDNEDSRSP